MDVEGIPTESVEAQALTALATAFGATDTLILFKNNLTPDKTTDAAALEESVAAWYTGQAKVVTYGTPYRLPDGRMVMRTNTIQYNFATGAGVDPETFYGAAVIDPAGPTLRAAARFPTAVTLGDGFDSLPVAVVIPVDRP